MLGDRELVAPYDLYLLTTEGKLYLRASGGRAFIRIRSYGLVNIVTHE
jgi:hypothetical protein